MDREVRFIDRLIIEFLDGINIVVVIVKVNIIDINDNVSVFFNVFYFFDVFEDILIGIIIVLVEVVDVD